MYSALRGVSFGEEVELTWRDGEATGHQGRVELLKRKAWIVRRLPVGHNPHTNQPLSPGPDHLANPHGAYHIMRWGIFREVLEEERGNVPRPPVTETGARYWGAGLG